MHFSFIILFFVILSASAGTTHFEITLERMHRYTIGGIPFPFNDIGNLARNAMLFLLNFPIQWKHVSVDTHSIVPMEIEKNEKPFGNSIRNRIMRNVICDSRMNHHAFNYDTGKEQKHAFFITITVMQWQV